MRNIGEKYQFQHRISPQNIKDSSTFIDPTLIDEYSQNEPDRNIDTYFGEANYYESAKA